MPKIRIAEAVQGFLDGSSIFQEPDKDYSIDPGRSAGARRLVAKMQAASRRKDGSITVELDPAEAEVLYGYTDVMVQGAGDNIGSLAYGDLDRSALAEYNSGRALMRKLAETFGPEVTRW